VRRGLGRGRALIGIGAVTALVGVATSVLTYALGVGTWLPWWSVGGDILPALHGRGFDGAGVLVFLASVGMLGVLTLPYASRHQSSALDRPAAYAALVLLGLIGIAIEVLTSFGEARLSGPDRAPGLWLAAVGMALATWGTAELAAEKPGPL
jgi:hypothetical protein